MRTVGDLRQANPCAVRVGRGNGKIAMDMQQSAKGSSPLKTARRTMNRAFVLIALFSIAVGLLLLAGPLYMLQVYDRVIPTGHVDTLLLLSAILVGAFAVLAALDALRALVAQRLGLWLERRLTGPVLAASAQVALLQPGVSAEGLRDVVTLRGYLGSPAVFPLFDAPMAPFFLAILFFIHPLLGLVALTGGAILFALALVNEWLTRRIMTAASGAALATYLATYEEADRAIRPGDAILDIVPKGDLLLVEAQVDPADVDVVRPGLPAEVRIQAFSASDAPLLGGEVVTVSADSLTDVRHGHSYYAARVRLGDLSGLPSGAALQPGMPAEVMIVTGERTALEYLIDPLRSRVARALRED